MNDLLAARLRVKPLEWYGRTVHEMVADTIVGRYRCPVSSGEVGVYLDDERLCFRPDEMAAKAAAQADYEARILSALESLSPPDGVGLETNAHERDQWRYSVNPFTAWPLAWMAVPPFDLPTPPAKDEQA